MTATQDIPALGPIARYEQNIIERITDFNDPRQEWRRLFSELLGTFLLVIVAAGGGMMGQAFPGVISRSAAVVAPALMVMGVILFMGKISGAHLNPAVSIAFALRRDFPWRRVPGYIVVQLIGATLAALVLHGVITVSAKYGSNYPSAGHSTMAAFWMELLLTAGLVSVIRHGVRCTEHRTIRCTRRRWLHRPGRTMGQSHLGRLDESGPDLWPRPGEWHLH
jgi:aquaporin Z